MRSVAVYLSDAFVQLNLLVNFGLLAVIIWLSVYIANPTQYTFGILVKDMDSSISGHQQVSMVAIVGSAFAGDPHLKVILTLARLALSCIWI